MAKPAETEHPIRCWDRIRILFDDHRLVASRADPSRHPRPAPWPAPTPPEAPRQGQSARRAGRSAGDKSDDPGGLRPSVLADDCITQADVLRVQRDRPRAAVSRLSRQPGARWLRSFRWGHGPAPLPYLRSSIASCWISAWKAGDRTSAVRTIHHPGR